MSLFPGELKIIYSKMPEVSKINFLDQQISVWHYHSMKFSFLKEKDNNTKVVTETLETNDDIRTKSDDSLKKETKQLKDNKRNRHDSGRFVDITL
ncbi:hypothetical protein [Natranaerobius trueperi]|uniref:Uncharacterized protein n=1 Tax=Natranaerobius trueperi TaxID=759412 RepID=A0A226BZ34_9FIRM|nr:hypothetical protein [Natranaerobius trueperi]OWZ84256.1 hypothetical protein CDO51_04150 [Natranaerobius trueperi]